MVGSSNHPITRRHRRLALAITLALAFVGVAVVVAVRALRPRADYTPGRRVEGLTSDLSRGLPPDYPRVTFVDVSKEAGIDFQHFWGQRTSQIPEDMGSGAAWGDYDNDGWPDLFIVNVAGPITLSPDSLRASPAHCALYHNNKNGTFTDVSAQAGVDLRIWGMGAEWGDYDNDGFLDLVVSAYGENVLFHNTGDGTFTNRTTASGIGGKRGFWSGVAWGDYDRDGFLDLYVTGYVKYRSPSSGMAAKSEQYDVENPLGINPNAYPPERNLLYHNNRNGTFTEVAGRAGVLGDHGKSLEAAWVDVDEDGWPDLYVANDVTDNQLFRNLHNGVFVDVSHEARVADYRSAMGLAIGDWDGDQHLDMFITHWIAQENALYEHVSNKPLAFQDVADRVGLGQVALDFVGWGTFFFDYDNDGKLDLFVANGHTFQRRDAPELLAPETAQLFWNHGPTDGFFEVGAPSGEYFRTPHVGRGAAFADYDNDGDLDVVVVNHSGRAVLLRNDGGNRNHWLNIRLEGRGRSNRTADGAKLRVVAGTSVSIREVGAQASYLSQNDLTEHVGLGALTQVDSVRIVWPSGTKQVLTNVAADQTIHIVEGGGATRVETTPDSTGGRQAVLEFWTLYRAATTARVDGRNAAARDAYRNALALNPRHEDVLYYLGNMELELGNFRDAETAWRRLVEINPASARTHSRLGDLYACPDTGAPWNLGRARTEFAQAAELNREETGPLLRLGEVALLRGDLAAARSQFDAVIVTHPKSVEAHFLKGYVAWKRGQHALAASELQQAEAIASAPQPVPQAPSEGDTKRGASGAAPLVTRSTRCRLVGDELDYGRLDRRLQQIAALHQ
ncbi:MAG TPA: FG-GAP-like repeat-containing protein [Gemmatimonadales bacterium]|nr:FG-GAP-like repeat-containing protein [Gemmatimonadales bacterium]